MKWLYYLLMLSVAGLFFVIGLANQEVVRVNYLSGSIELPLVWVLLAAFVFGAILAMLVFGLRAWYWKMNAKTLSARIQQQARDAHHQKVREDFVAEQERVSDSHAA